MDKNVKNADTQASALIRYFMSNSIFFAISSVPGVAAADRREPERGGAHADARFRMRGRLQSGLTLIHIFNRSPCLVVRSGRGFFALRAPVPLLFYTSAPFSSGCTFPFLPFLCSIPPLIARTRRNATAEKPTLFPRKDDSIFCICCKAHLRFPREKSSFSWSSKRIFQGILAQRPRCRYWAEKRIGLSGS